MDLKKSMVSVAMAEHLAGGLPIDVPRFPRVSAPVNRGFQHRTKYRPRKNERKRKLKQQKLARRANRSR